jgi:formylglycine-generating enzyme required for sulfatase activity
MPIIAINFLRNLLVSILCLFAMTACGVEENAPSSRSSGTGSYAARLTFPADIPRIDAVANALTGIDCKEQGIAVLRFAFFDGADTPLVEDQFPCSAHQATIKNIQAGNNRRVVVTAEDQKGEVLLQGEENHIIIRKNQATQGGDIEMKPAKPTNDNQGQDQDGDGFSPPQDCDDTNADINPDAEEIPANNIDENCDGQVASPTSFTIDDLGMTFVRIPAGTFIMGSPATELGRDADEIQHQVTLTQDFYMQTTEVTQGQWQVVMGNNPSYFQNCGLNCPVESVSWDDIQVFMARFNAQRDDGYEYRLPTEAQWEYAARAGSDAAFYGGDITVTTGNDPILNTLGWYWENSDAGYEGCIEIEDGRCIGPQPVRGKNPNAWGLFDMHGNVWEWCSDWYGDYPSGSVADPVGPSSGSYRILRGGSWNYPPWRCRSSSRSFSHFRGLPGFRGFGIGFRLVARLLSR